MGRISEYVRNYPKRLWQRLPVLFGGLGLMMLGFGRKAARYEAETGNQLSMPAIGGALLLVGVALFGLQVYRRRAAPATDAV